MSPVSSIRTTESYLEGDFRLTDQGVEYYDGTSWLRVCSHLEVVAYTRNSIGEDWGRLLRVIDSDDVQHEWAMPMSMLASDGHAYREHLLGLGLQIQPGPAAKKRLHDYITTSDPVCRARCVERTGWHDNVFVLPERTFGDSDERVILQSSGRIDCGVSTEGTLEDWRNNVAAPCAGNSRLILGIGVAFAAPVLHLVGAESGGIHLRGASSTGKTTALLVAGSVCGGGGANGYIRTWRATDNGLEGVASAHCDLMLALDEIGQVDPRRVGEIAYMLANGAGKTRARRNGAARTPQEWRILFLSSGELSIAEKMREVHKQARAGQEVRLIDVPADAGQGRGLFENLHDFDNGGDLARHLKAMTQSYYGSPIVAFLEQVVRDPVAARERIQELRRQFVAGFCPKNADGQVERVADRFGIIAGATVLAAAYGIIPLTNDDIVTGVGECFTCWLEERGSLGPAEIDKGIAQVRRYFQKYGDARFDIALSSPAWKDNEDCIIGRSPTNRAGFRKSGKDGHMDFLVFPEVWREEICAGYDHKLIEQRLIEENVLLSDGEGNPTRPERIPGKPGLMRFYRLTPEILGRGCPDSEV